MRKAFAVIFSSATQEGSVFTVLSSYLVKKGEKNIPLTPLSIDRINLKNDLIKTLNGAVDNSITKGGYISVLKDRKTLLEIGNNYDKQTLLPVASLSKSFTALAILKLQEEGKLKLQDKVLKISKDLNLSIY